MFDKINKNLSVIIYRYEWQSKINRVDEDYKVMYYWGVNVNRGIRGILFRKGIYSLNDGTHYNRGRTIAMFNYRSMTKDRSMIIGRYNIKTKTKKIYFIELTSGYNLENYVYTSTKYLREIKERGLKCLIDNV